MTTTRSDDDLERLLRSTLDSRAATVSTGPAWTGVPDDIRPQGRWIAALVAAALVLALVAAFVALRVRRPDSSPAAPPRNGAMDLTSFPVTGYPTVGMLFGRTYRAVAVRAPGGTTGKDRADALVFAFGPHGYDLRGFGSQARITVDGHPGFRGNAPAILNGDRHRLPTIVWNYVPGQWAVAQAVEGRRAPSTATLLRVASAAHPTGHLTIATTFRFNAVPAGFRIARAEVLASEQATVVMLRNRRGAMLTVTSTPASSKLAQGMLASDVIRHGDQLLVVDASEPKTPATRADKAAAAFLRTHLVWEPSTLDHVVP